MSSRKPPRQASAPESVDALFLGDIGDEEGRARWKRAVQTREDEQALLHRTVVTSKRQNLELQYERVGALIPASSPKRKLLLQHALLASERERFEASRSSDWFCLAAFPSARDRRVTVDVGGQLFELSAAVAAKDPASLLAAFVQDDSPLSTNESGCFRVDRDWWLFRHILRFLRDGILPSDAKLLRDLYVESEFWRFESLQKAIEAKNLSLWQSKPSDAAGKPSAKANDAGAKGEAPAGLKDAGTWWLEPPAWWGVAEKATKEVSKPKEKASLLASTFRKKNPLLAKQVAQSKTHKAAKGGDQDEQEDTEAWWKSTTYKNANYMDIFAKNKAQPADEGDGRTPRSPLIVHNTWAASMTPRE
ncbi:hypothetical protein BBJ28_00013711 [Nothophytophthora sp. Chile5]|nr:hypothetical protein BBJ28_00013711 [Nothophytophthora sp. Chile5]